jgi:two-component system response regulator FlrC
VLLQGESGTGKEVVARYIHQHSAYHDGPFIAINCAAIPEHMLEAMLFGYEKGAFTGATQSVPGKFEVAQGGTLLLDEVSEMPLALQAKLLRVLQEKEVERLGSHQKIRLQLRILATTNRTLKDYVAQGLFREDLYYRLSVFPIKIPPLRERVGDILPLAQDLIRRHSPKNTPFSKPPLLDPAALEKLRAYTWPGNVRELENVLQRALVVHEEGHITPVDLVFDGDSVIYSTGKPMHDASMSTQVSNDTLDDGVRLAEAQMILQTLQTQNGSRKLTAQTLGVSDRTLRYKIARMKEAGIVIPC